jgi:hypothetical protein
MQILLFNHRIPEKWRRPISWSLYVASCLSSASYAAVSFAWPLQSTEFSLIEYAGRALVAVILLVGAYLGLHRSRQYPTFKYLALQICHLAIAVVVMLSSLDAFGAKAHWMLMIGVLVVMGGVTFQMGEAHKNQ